MIPRYHATLFTDARWCWHRAPAVILCRSNQGIREALLYFLTLDGAGIERLQLYCAAVGIRIVRATVFYDRAFDSVVSYDGVAGRRGPAHGKVSGTVRIKNAIQ